MHIADGIAPTYVVVTSGALSGAAVLYSLKKTSCFDYPKIAGDIRKVLEEASLSILRMTEISNLYSMAIILVPPLNVH